MTGGKILRGGIEMRFPLSIRILISPVKFILLILAGLIACFLTLIGEEGTGDAILFGVLDFGTKEDRTVPWRD